MKKIIFASVAMGAIVRAFMSDTTEVVTIKGADGSPVRVNKHDYEADQAGAKTMHLHKDDAEQSISGVQTTTYPPGVQPTAAPSAPNFGGIGAESGGSPPVIDPVKNAVAPGAPSPNSLLISTEGTGTKARVFVVDGTGAKVVHGLITPEGYKTEKEAWDAILAVQKAGGEHPAPAPSGEPQPQQ